MDHLSYDCKAESKYQDVPEVTENAVDRELVLDKICMSNDSSSLVDEVCVWFNVDLEVVATED